MQLQHFLARVVAPGPYAVATYSRPPGTDWKTPVRSNFYDTAGRTKIPKDAFYRMNRQSDVWFAHASFRTGEIRANGTTGESYLHVDRTQANVAALRCFVLDADVSRPGDGKNPAQCFANRGEAVGWVADFCTAINLPPPNVTVNSGYGYHFYWVLNQEIDLPTWQPLAYALKAAVLARGWTSDTSSTIDAARILRVPQTLNYKDPANPAPVEVVDYLSLPHDYALIDIAAALQPWVGLGHIGHAPSGSKLGPKPAHATGAFKINQHAHAGMEDHARSFALIAGDDGCEQVKRSLANQGDGDSRDVWFKGHITLGVFTHDFQEGYLHEISKGDQRYDAQNTDAHMAQAESEVHAKDLGAPTCAAYDGYRPGVCQACPHWGKIKSPIALGVEREAEAPGTTSHNPSDLPPRYRRGAGFIERNVDGKWLRVLEGDFSNAMLDELPTGGHALAVTYTYSGKQFAVRVTGSELGDERGMYAKWEKQGVHLHTRSTPQQLGDLFMSWIGKLRSARAERTDLLRPFGWVHNAKGERIGAAIAGTLYRTDGTVEQVAGGDTNIRLMYTPMGRIEPWRRAAALFEGGRIDMQALIASSFAAPLMVFTGHRGTALNFWSKESAIGKSSAIAVANGVWAGPKALQGNRDTPNAALGLLSEAKFMPKYWDELRVAADWQRQFVELLFMLPQGKERTRMASDTSIRPVGEWDTLMIFTSNRSIMDYVLAETSGTDAGAARAMEYMLPRVDMPLKPEAALLIKAIETNHGHAGRVYLQYLATHVDEVQAKITRVQQSIAAKLTPQSVERFHVAAIACMIVGASIATELELFAFDVRGVHDYLLSTFEATRSELSDATIIQHATTGAAGYDLEQLLGQFMADFTAYRMVTPTLGKQTKMDAKDTHWPSANEVRVQIATTSKMLRIDRKAFLDWAMKNNIPGRAMLKQMREDWGATDTKQTLAAGTWIAGGQIYVVDVPLTASPGLASYLVSPDAPTNVRPMRTAGNQARV